MPVRFTELLTVKFLVLLQLFQPVGFQNILESHVTQGYCPGLSFRNDLCGYCLPSGYRSQLHGSILKVTLQILQPCITSGSVDTSVLYGSIHQSDSLCLSSFTFLLFIGVQFYL